MKSEKEREKKRKKKDQSLREIWDTIKCINICIMEVPGKHKVGKDQKKIFEEIIAQKLAKFDFKKPINLHIQEDEQSLRVIKAKRSIPRDSMVKMLKNKKEILNII